MAGEIAETPDVVARLVARRPAFTAVAAAITRAAPVFAVTCGRGSSGHVGTYLAYLLATRLGLVTAPALPSIVTAYGGRPRLAGQLFVVVSQSGRSPDIMAATEAARAAGALTVAIVNDGASPVAAAADHVVDIDAGMERAVAATKSLVASMAAAAMLVAAIAEDRDLAAALDRLPARLASAATRDWSPWGDALATASGLFVVGRGLALAPARELALKAMEVLGVPGLGFSAAELHHGPRAAVTPTTPVLALPADSATAASVEELALSLAAAGARVHRVGADLPWIAPDHAALDPLATLPPAYRAIEAAARARSRDPDRPPGLAKVTRTL
jgi:glucosamine--fructose-6-phosphate aminotransferase (isomerizing)